MQVINQSEWSKSASILHHDWKFKDARHYKGGIGVGIKRDATGKGWSVEWSRGSLDKDVVVSYLKPKPKTCGCSCSTSLQANATPPTNSFLIQLLTPLWFYLYIKTTLFFNTSSYLSPSLFTPNMEKDTEDTRTFDMDALRTNLPHK